MNDKLKTKEFLRARFIYFGNTSLCNCKVISLECIYASPSTKVFTFCIEG